MLGVVFVFPGGLLLAWILARWFPRLTLLVLRMTVWATGISLAGLAWIALDWFWPLRLLPCLVIALVFALKAARAVEWMMPLMPRSKDAARRLKPDGHP